MYKILSCQKNTTIPNWEKVKELDFRGRLLLSDFFKGNLGNSLPNDPRVVNNDIVAQSFQDNPDGSMSTVFFGNEIYAAIVVILALVDDSEKDNTFWAFINNQLPNILNSAEYEYKDSKIHLQKISSEIQLTVSSNTINLGQTSVDVGTGQQQTVCRVLGGDQSSNKQKINNIIKSFHLHAPNPLAYEAVQSSSAEDISYQERFETHLLETNKVPKGLLPIHVRGAHHAMFMTLANLAAKHDRVTVVKDESGFMPRHIFDSFPNVNLIELPTIVDGNIPILDVTVNDFETRLWDLGRDHDVFPPMIFNPNIKSLNHVATVEDQLTDIPLRIIEAIGNKDGEIFDIKKLEGCTKETVIFIDGTYVGNTTHDLDNISKLFSFLEEQFDTVIYAGSLGKDGRCWGERIGYIASNNEEFNNFFNNSISQTGVAPSEKQKDYLRLQLDLFDKKNWELAAENAQIIRGIIAKNLEFPEEEDLEFVKISSHGGAFGSVIVKVNDEERLIRFNLIPRDKENNIRAYSEDEIKFIEAVFSGLRY